MADNNGAVLEDVFAFAKQQYGTEPEYLWLREPSGAVLRHKENNKWYAVMLRVARKRLGLSGDGAADIMAVKCDPLMKEALLKENGVMPAYHMNKQSWISVLLDGSAEKDIVFGCLRMSYDLTAAVNGNNRTVPKKWIIPANPRICELENEFDEKGEIHWTQSAKFIKGDRVYIYIGAPVSELRYECSVEETDLSFDFGNEQMNSKKAIRLKLIRRFGKGEFTAERLRELGVTNIRGPRGITRSLEMLL